MSFEPLAPPAASEPAISVALVEDEAGTRERLVRALGQASRLFLAHAAGTGQALLDWLGSNSVDVLLVDLGLPDIPGDPPRTCLVSRDGDHGDHPVRGRGQHDARLRSRRTRLPAQGRHRG